MALMRKVSSKKIYMGKLSYGADLLEEITRVCVNHDISLGQIEALGAVQKAKVGYYNQQSQEYQFLDIDKPLEIAGLVGNISLKDGLQMVHAHITLSDENGQAYGGHLAPGTIVFACELIVRVFDGPEYTRGFDQQTGLPLWDMSPDDE